MRSDLDGLIRERDLAGLVVLAPDRYSPSMYYATGEKLHVALYLRAPDGRAHLIYDPMERDQAARVPGDRSSLPQHGFRDLVESEGGRAGAWGRLIADMCANLGMKGRIAFHGDCDLGFGHEVVMRACAVNPDIEATLDQPDVLTMARTAKDADEIEAIRRAARGTVNALARLRTFLSGLRPDGVHFRHGGSGRVTLGTLRRLLNVTFVEHGLAEDGESIVSQGRDAGVPHNRGNDAEPLRAGAPLLVDIFPGEAGGGYHSDVTRTYCLGPVPEPLARLYGDVRDAFETAMSKVAVGTPCRDLQEDVCALFESRGHATLRTDGATQEGYVHSLGHGVGLSVHEEPRLGGPPTNITKFEPGMVVTVEPGLYYPSRDLGVRIEDLVVIHPDGTVENLTAAAPHELEIEPRA